MNEVITTGVAHHAQGELARLVRSADGELEDVYWDFVYAPLRDSGGLIDGVLVAGFEVTAQVRAAQELSQLLSKAEAGERQFRELVENLPDMAWTARQDGFMDYYNRRWYEYTGTTAAQMQGWGWQALVDPVKLDAVVDRWHHSIESGESFEMEFPIRGADGLFRWFLTRVRPLHDERGGIVRWFGSSTDIHERRRSDEFRDTFLGILGHDLRNPLHTIVMSTEVLKRLPNTPDEIRTRLVGLKSSAERMRRMIEQLLDLTRARLTEGIPVILSERPLNVAPLVTKIVEEIRLAHPQTRIEIHAQGDCSARFDADRLEQVLSNLLENAVTHGDRDRPIRVLMTAQPSTVSLTVQNHGPPIDPDFLPLLFSPFARGGRAGGSAAGLGLGLYIAERIIDAHGGKLLVESSLEAGTRFEVTLPRSGWDSH